MLGSASIATLAAPSRAELETGEAASRFATCTLGEKHLAGQSRVLQVQGLGDALTDTKLALIPFWQLFVSVQSSHNGNIVLDFVVMKGFTKAARELHPFWL